MDTKAKPPKGNFQLRRSRYQANYSDDPQLESYESGSFTVDVEERENGWGFRMKSSKFYCLLCMGGFEGKDDALDFTDDLVQFVEDSPQPLATKAEGRPAGRSRR